MAKIINLECLVEVHNLSELEKALVSETRIIGINNRNLNDFSVDSNTTLNLVEKIPDHILKVSESGIFNREHISLLENLKVQISLSVFYCVNQKHHSKNPCIYIFSHMKKDL